MHPGDMARVEQVVGHPKIVTGDGQDATIGIAPIGIVKIFDRENVVRIGLLRISRNELRGALFSPSASGACERFSGGRLSFRNSSIAIIVRPDAPAAASDGIYSDAVAAVEPDNRPPTAGPIMTGAP